MTEPKKANETPPDAVDGELSEEKLESVSGGSTNIPVVSQIEAGISIVASFVRGFVK